jgi:cell division protease FtsH
MSTKLNDLRTEIDSKKEILENARITLKKEFIGIDKPIDTIIDSINSWFILSKIQERPFIINLWGLTGVGKTSLINRLVSLLHYENFYYRFDLGNKKGKYSLKSGLDELCEHKIEKPVIIALDEFQHTRTLEGFPKTEKEDENRILWDVIDSGKIQHQIYKYGVWRMSEYHLVLKRLLSAGVVVEHGKILHGWEICKNEHQIFDEKTKLFISKSVYENLIDLAGEELDIKLKSELSQLLLQLNGEESLHFIKKVISIARKPIERDFSKALIFVMGNLDEAYAMSDNYSIDISADEFHRESLKINISRIKKALQSRFRHEQIARLGNIHVIYPSLSQNAYEAIIRKELHAISIKIKELTQLKIVFQESVVQLIYEEGVYPTQGVRPVLTTINCLIRNRITTFLATILNLDLVANQISLAFVEDKFLQCHYLKGTTKIHSETLDLSSELKKHQLNKQDDLQAITAVHESGHALLSAILLKTVPKYVFSSTLEEDVNGFVFSEFKWKYISKKEIIFRLAMFPGGMAAEELIFGKENVTTGSGSDLKQATNFALRMLKKEGMGRVKFAYQPAALQTNYFANSYKKIEKEAEALIQKAHTLALKTLTQEKVLLLELSVFLSQHSSIKQFELQKLMETYLTKKIDFITNGNFLFYKNHLEQQHKKIKTAEVQTASMTVCLNKEVR